MIDLDRADGRETLEFLRASFDEQVAAEVRQVQAISHLATIHGCYGEADVFAGADGLIDDEAFKRERRVRLGADGTPPVAEWLALEIGPLLGISPTAAALMLVDVLNLRERHPQLWQAVLDGQVRFWQAKQITRRTATAGLSWRQAVTVDEQLTPSVGHLPWGRVLKLLDGLIVAADPAKAEERVERNRQARFVRRAETVTDGVATMVARVGVGDAIRFDAMLTRLSDILAQRGDADPGDVRRARAFGILATPARALALLQSAARPAACEPGDEPPDDDPATAETTPSGCAGHICGSITVDPDRLLPKSTLIVHVSEESLRGVDGVARVENGCPLPISQLRELLADSVVTVRPIFQTGQLAPVDSYEIPERFRASVLQRDPYEVFPFSNRPSTGLDLDHTVPFDHSPGAPPGQTREDNLGPLARRTHRAKTHGAWRVLQHAPGFFEWTSPYGFTYLVGPHGTIAYRRATQGIGRWGPDTDEYDEVA